MSARADGGGPPRRARGFPLVELMVTIAVGAILAMVAMPFTASWVDSARQMEARNLLREGAGHARAVALRNPAGVPVAEAAVRLRTGDDGLLEVVQRVPGGTDVVAWQGRIHPSLTLKTAAGNFSCIDYSSRGATMAKDAACVVAPRVSVVGRDPEEPIDVELL